MSIKQAIEHHAVLSHVTAIDTMVRIYLESEEKAI